MTRCARRSTRAPARRSALRGTVLFAVLVVLVLGARGGATILLRAGAQAASAEASARRVQARAVAWSGLQAVLSQLEKQRPAMLAGETPTLDPEIVVFTAPGGVRGVARLIEVGGPGEPTVPEAGKLNLNACTPEMLAATGLVPLERAREIVAAAASGPFGDTDDASIADPPADEPALAPIRPGESAPMPVPRAVRDWLTTVSADPNVIGAAPPPFTELRGRARHSLTRADRGDLRKFLGAALPDGTAGFVESLGGRPSASRAELIAALTHSGLPPRQWGVWLDLLTTTDAPYAIGLVDLSRASPEVLACVPGITIEKARRLVEVRQRLDPDAKTNLAWPVVEGVLGAEEFQKAADRLTLRCLQWRVRVEGVVERAAEAASHADGRRRGGNDAADAVPDARVVWDVVVDASGPAARVAVLRDVTLESARAAWQHAGELWKQAREPGENPIDAGPAAKVASAPSPADDTAPVPPPALEARADASARTPESPAPGPAQESGSAAAKASGPDEAQDRRVGRWRPPAGRPGGR